MRQYIIVMAIVGVFTACFFGVPASLAVGRNLTALWIVGGFVVIFLGPLFDLARLFRYFYQRVTSLFRY